MLSLQVPVLICADLLDQPGGTLDVGEEEGEQAHGQAASEPLQGDLRLTRDPPLRHP